MTNKKTTVPTGTNNLPSIEGRGLNSRFSRFNFTKSILFILIAFSTLLLLSSSAMAATIYIDDSTDFENIANRLGTGGPKYSSWTMTDDYIIRQNVVVTITGSQWQSIGGLAHFTGSLTGESGSSIVIEGTNHEIEFLSSSADRGAGLFGMVSGTNAKFEDLTIIVNANITSPAANGNNSGILVGHAREDTSGVSFINCNIIINAPYSFKPEGPRQHGGLVGAMTGGGLIENCTITGGGSIIGNGADVLGGLVGTSSSTLSIKNSTSSILVSGGGLSVGGLAGNLGTAQIFNSSSTGDVIGTIQVGGLVGNVNSNLSTFSKSYSTGNVSAIYDGTNLNTGADVGGLIGVLQGGTVSECYSTGTVKADVRFAGGLIAYIKNDTVVSDCYSTSSVYAYAKTSDVDRDGRFAGGLVGYINGSSRDPITFTNCYSAGEIVSAAGNSAGGLIGSIHDPSTPPRTPDLQAIVHINDCYSLVGTVSAPSLSGKIIGDVNSTQMYTSTFSDIRVWNGISGGTTSNESAIPIITAGITSINKADIYKNQSGWPTFAFAGGSAIWRMASTDYGLPVFITQTVSDEPSNVNPMNESKGGSSGGGGKGPGATISNNSSVNNNTTNNNTTQNPPIYTPPSGNDSNPNGSDTTNGSNTSGSNTPGNESGNTTKNSGFFGGIKTWFGNHKILGYGGLILLILIIAGVAVYFVKFRGKDY